MKKIFLIPIFFFECVINTSAQTVKGTPSFPPPISTTPFFKKNTYALIIGVSKYQDTSINLNYADSDALAFHDFLRSDAGGKVPDSNINIIMNNNATFARIDLAFRWLHAKPLKDSDRLFIYFSGHGATNVNDISYLLLNDIKTENLNNSPLGHLDGAINVWDLKFDIKNYTTKKRVSVFLIVDACRTGYNVTTSTFTFDASDNILLASQNGHPSEEDNPKNKRWGGHGVFTYFLLKGLEGEADGWGEDTKTGNITIDELKTYLTKKVSDSTNQKQLPDIIDNVNPNLVISEVDTPTLIAFNRITKHSNNFLVNAPSASINSLNNINNSNKDTFILASRGIDPNSIAQSLYKYFSLSLSKDNLIGNDSSADYYFNKLENSLCADSVKKQALNSFYAALGNDGQKIINIYLSDNMDNLLKGKLKNVVTMSSVFEEGEKKMKRLYDLCEKYYPGSENNINIKVRCLFLKASRMARSKNILQLNEAEDTIKQALMIDSTEPYFYHTLALIYLHEKKYDLAISEDKKALNYAPNWGYAYNSIGYAYMQSNKNNKFDTAQLYYLKSIKVDSTDLFAYNNLIYIYYTLKQYYKAEQFCLRIIRLNPTEEDGYKKIADIYRDSTQYDKAIVSFQKAYSINPKDTEIIFNISCCYSLMKDTENAVFYLNQYLHLKSYSNGLSNDIYTEIQKSQFDNIRSAQRFKDLMKEYFPNKDK